MVFVLGGRWSGGGGVVDRREIGATQVEDAVDFGDLHLVPSLSLVYHGSCTRDEHSKQHKETSKLARQYRKRGRRSSDQDI